MIKNVKANKVASLSRKLGANKQAHDALEMLKKHALEEENLQKAAMYELAQEKLEKRSIRIIDRLNKIVRESAK